MKEACQKIITLEQEWESLDPLQVVLKLLPPKWDWIPLGQEADQRFHCLSLGLTTGTTGQPFTFGI